LISQIGHGGMSSVWLAERNDGRFERRVAVKFLNIALMGEIGEERFRREGRILGLLAHPHIAELVDAGVSEAGQPYLVIEHVEGGPIDSHCDDRLLCIRLRIRLFLDVLGAVPQAHFNLALIQEGLRELPLGSQYDVDRIFCLRRGSEVAQERGDPQQGIARMQAVQRILKQSPFDSDILELHASTELAEAYHVAGQNQLASPPSNRPLRCCRPWGATTRKPP
jgi:hypothetical protein